MRTGPAAGRTGYLHELVTYDSDAELLDAVVPFLEDGAAAGEPTYASLPDREAALVRHAAPRSADVAFVPPLSQQRPATILKGLAAMFDDALAAGVEQVRVVNTVPHPGLDAPWDGWCRYEAVVNHLFRDLPVWGMCLYDRRITPPRVLRDVERTHTHLHGATDHRPNPRYQDPASFLRSLPPPGPDVFEARTPTVDVPDPVPATARRAVREVAQGTGLTDDEVDELLVATSEAVTNAHLHGRAPVRLRAWAGRERVLVTVNDAGEGPTDPYAGLVPRPSAMDGGGGYGLWIMHQLLAVTHARRADGYTVSMVAGRPLVDGR
jgi:anti-sigma regulatory factor (Ser/Thr protein kinase)